MKFGTVSPDRYTGADRYTGVAVGRRSTVFDTENMVDMDVVEQVRPTVPDVVDSHAVFAMVGVDAVQIGEEIPMDCDTYCDMWDPRNYFETVDGMPVYCGGDFNDSNCEDPRDLAYEDWVDWYNFSALEGCCVDLPDKEEDRLPIIMGNREIGLRSCRYG